MTPKHFKIARTLIGTHEIAGRKANPKILKFFEKVGRGEIKSDEIAWCAAFVGACLYDAGHSLPPLKRRLLARSYTNYGRKVELENAQIGDIVVLQRGNSSWQGHVAFFGGWVVEGKTFKCLGGNQRNRVSEIPRSTKKVIAVRRPLKRSIKPAKNPVKKQSTRPVKPVLGTKHEPISPPPKYKTNSFATSLLSALAKVWNTLKIQRKK